MRGKHWTYTIEIRYRDGTRHLRRIVSASDYTAILKVYRHHLSREKELMSILITDKWPRAKKDRQAFLAERKRKASEKLAKRKQEYIDYDGEKDK